MLSARNTIAAVVAIAVLSVAYTVYKLATPPDGGGFGNNSYGTRAHGHRAIYETLEQLKQPVDRLHHPPPSTLADDDYLVMVMPDQNLVENEPEHLRRTAEWVNEGGNLLVALEAVEWNRSSFDDIDDTWDTTVQEELGIIGIETVSVSPFPIESESDEAAEKARIEREKVLRWQVNEERPTAATTVTLEGVFAGLTDDVQTLRLPGEELQVMTFTTSAPAVAGKITVASDNGVAYTLAAHFPRGKGSITVVSDGSLFSNYMLTAEDNAVLTANLLGAGERRIVVDEFFHGLNFRGNPLWLLTRPHYGWLFVMAVLAAGIWIWRQSVAFGPPLPPKDASRRTLTEYLDAMASLFTRSRQQMFVLAELRSGVLWSLRTELHLSPAQEKLETIAEVLERRDPARARRLRAASAEIDNVLAKWNAVDNEKFIELTREISRCL